MPILDFADYVKRESIRTYTALQSELPLKKIYQHHLANQKQEFNTNIQ